MQRILRLVRIFLLAFLAIILVPPLSPLLLPASLIALWYFSNKKPNEKLKKYARNGAIASAIGLMFFINMDTEPDSEVATTTDTQEIISDVETVSDGERLKEEQADKEAEREQRKKEARERIAIKKEKQQEEKEKREQERIEREKEREEEEKKLAEANPNKTGETEAPTEPVELSIGQEEAKVNNNIPQFSNEDITSIDVYHRNGPLDSLGRVTAANAVVGVEIMPAEERGDISMHEPTGRTQARYANVGSGGWLYHRSHLIGHQLTGNDDYANIMTGTQWFNMRMLEYENYVANYVETTENHVRYRVTPIFEGNNLVASGAYMEAFSIEDNGEGVMFNVYIPNVQPGVEINYADGSSIGPEGPSQEGEIQQYNPPAQSASGNVAQELPPEPTPQTPPTPAPAPPPAAEVPPVTITTSYVGNANTMKFHTSGCHHVKRMAEHNKVQITSREEAIGAGYEPCKVCNP